MGLVGLAVAVVAVGLNQPDALSATAPIDLRAGAMQTIVFRAKTSGSHEIGLEMDQATAKRLFPCMADPLIGDFYAKCGRDQRRYWPVDLAFTLSAGGVDISREIDRPLADAGGQYGGGESYTWEAAYVPLSAEKTYRLTVRSLSDGTALNPAHPRLVVENSEAGFFDREALFAFASYVAAFVLLLLAALWSLTVWLRSRRSRRIMA